MPQLRSNGIDHLNLHVQSLEKTVDFYHRLLGFRELEDLPDDNGKIIGDAKAKLAIYEVEGFPHYEKHGLSHIGFNIANFDDVEGRCSEIGAEILYGGVVQWPGTRSIYVKDPNGYELELTEVWGADLAK